MLIDYANPSNCVFKLTQYPKHFLYKKNSLQVNSYTAGVHTGVFYDLKYTTNTHVTPIFQSITDRWMGLYIKLWSLHIITLFIVRQY